MRSRYGAFLIDILFSLVLCFMGALLVGSAGVEFNAWNAVAVITAYFGLLPATPLQATPGKLSFGIRIVDVHGKQLTVWRSLGRFAASVPSIGLLGLGFVVAAWTARRQAVHDLASGTIVVGLGEVPREAPPPLPLPARIAACLVVVSSAALVYANFEIYHVVMKRQACVAGNAAKAAVCAKQ